MATAKILEKPTRGRPKANQEVLFKAFKGPQTKFLQATEREVLHFGGRGSAKSDALIADFLPYASHPKAKGLLLRKQINDLRELIDRAKRLFKPFNGQWKQVDNSFKFPSGATLYCGYFENDKDVERYIGHEYCWIGIDEIGQLGEEILLDKLLQSLRGCAQDLAKVARYTTNPGGKGWSWLRKRFVSPTEFIREEYIDELGEQRHYRWSKYTKEIEIPGFENQKMTRKTIWSTVFNNPYLLENDPGYIGQLSNIQNDILRRQWFEGDPDAIEGTAFSEFDRSVHVVEPFRIPDHWEKFRACDWGYTSMAACLWFALDHEKNLYVYRELTTTGVRPEQFAQLVLEREAGEYVSYGVMDDSAWDHRGIDSIATIMEDNGCYWQQAGTKGHKNIRVQTKMLVHELLSKDLETGEPKLKIFSTCKNLIEELGSIPLSDKNPEDVDTTVQDHHYDALRYGLMSRPLDLSYSRYAPKQYEPINVSGTMLGF